jgi:glycosyltransferase involved in cell wall biosynthesis
MNNSPQITTIIPTFRRPLQLKRAIRSVLNQTYPHFEVWVYDNASGDETASVVAELAREDSRVKYHCHPQNIDAAPNFDYGMQHVKTPFFSFLSDDDLLLPEFYETAIAGFLEFPQAAFSAGAVIDMTEEGRFLAISKTTLLERELRIPPQGLFNMITDYINWTAILFRQEVISTVGSLDFSVKPIDLDFVLRTASRFSYAVAKKPCGIFIHHPSSYSGKSGLKMIWPSWPKIIQNLKSLDCLTPQDKEVAEVLMKSKMGDLLTYIAKEDILNKKLDQLLPIADLLLETPRGSFRGKALRVVAQLCKNNTFFKHLFFICSIQTYKFYKWMKNFRAQRQYEKIL